jgi:membrane protein DedA with SNARE-associated domain
MIGTFLEGETLLVLAGLAAHRGYLNLTSVILAAFVGSLCGDQLFFYLGRRHSEFLIRRRPVWQPKLQQANQLTERYQAPLILGFRFLYGLRTAMPFAIGLSDVPLLRFVLLNAIGAGVWAVVVGSGGYLFGQAIDGLIGDVRRYEVFMFTLVAVAGAGVWAIYLYRRRRNGSETNKYHRERWQKPSRRHGLLTVGAS